jgi:hypothetical protein
MAQTLMNMYNVLFNKLKFLSNQIRSDWQDPVVISTLNGNNFYILFPPVPKCNHQYPSNDHKHKPQKIIHISQENA